MPGGAPAGLVIDRSRASPNHGERAAGPGWPDMVVLHYTGMADCRSAIDRLCDPASQVSCHYLVREDGHVLALVPEERRAWVNGRSVWQGVTDTNSAAIGIEIVNGGHDFGLPDFPDAQIGAVIALCRDVIGRWAIRAHRVLAHSDIAPDRKRDPGERFPWQRLARAGVGLWVEPSLDESGPVLRTGAAGPEVLALQDSLARYGYGVPLSGVYDGGTEAVVSAFQRHFRPARVDGRADPGTCDTLRRLIEALPQAAADA